MELIIAIAMTYWIILGFGLAILRNRFPICVFYSFILLIFVFGGLFMINEKRAIIFLVVTHSVFILCTIIMAFIFYFKFSFIQSRVKGTNNCFIAKKQLSKSTNIELDN